jgi:hypothetical protein
LSVAFTPFGFVFRVLGRPTRVPPESYPAAGGD